jgi:hypothetical protein
METPPGAMAQLNPDPVLLPFVRPIPPWKLQGFNSGSVGSIVELVFMAYAAVLIIIEVREICTQGIEWLIDWWNFADALTYALVIVAVSIRARLWALVLKDDLLEKIVAMDPAEEKWIWDLYDLQTVVLTFTAFVCWLKVLKHLSKLPVVGSHVNALASVFVDENVFFFFLFFVLIAFSLGVALHVGFGGYFFDFASIPRSFISIFRSLLEGGFPEDVADHNVTGGVFQIVVIIVVGQLISGTLFGILVGAYEDAKAAREASFKGATHELLAGDLWGVIKKKLQPSGTAKTVESMKKFAPPGLKKKSKRQQEQKMSKWQHPSEPSDCYVSEEFPNKGCCEFEVHEGYGTFDSEPVSSMSQAPDEDLSDFIAACQRRCIVKGLSGFVVVEDMMYPARAGKASFRKQSYERLKKNLTIVKKSTTYLTKGFSDPEYRLAKDMSRWNAMLERRDRHLFSWQLQAPVWHRNFVMQELEEISVQASLGEGQAQMLEMLSPQFRELRSLLHLFGERLQSREEAIARDHTRTTNEAALHDLCQRLEARLAASSARQAIITI